MTPQYATSGQRGNFGKRGNLGIPEGTIGEFELSHTCL
jgi:hypothetical protein